MYNFPVSRDPIGSNKQVDDQSDSCATIWQENQPAGQEGEDGEEPRLRHDAGLRRGGGVTQCPPAGEGEEEVRLDDQTQAQGQGQVGVLSDVPTYIYSPREQLVKRVPSIYEQVQKEQNR